MKTDYPPLWQPSRCELTESNLARFARANGLDAADYPTLHRWSVSEPDAFWNAVWDFTGVIGERGNVVLQRRADEEMFGARWYPDTTLNFAENLLCGEDARLAVVEAAVGRAVRSRRLGTFGRHGQRGRVTRREPCELLDVGPGVRRRGRCAHL